MDAIVSAILVNANEAIRTVILLGICACLMLICGWIWRANTTLVKLEWQIKALQDNFKMHDEWERATRDRWEPEIKALLEKVKG